MHDTDTANPEIFMYKNIHVLIISCKFLPVMHMIQELLYIWHFFSCAALAQAHGRERASDMD